MPNIDSQTVEGFGAEWTTFDQSGVSSAELDELFERYFRILGLLAFEWESGLSLGAEVPAGAVIGAACRSCR